ncbi:MAG: hypothetical protein QGH51_02365 [Planctomycetota bacterium]|nr:hypothetical protein [Planctomycetota bacterium]MDP6940847.1 hypothetical protein [Planctomycetota bacterium]
MLPKLSLRIFALAALLSMGACSSGDGSGGVGGGASNSTLHWADENGDEPLGTGWDQPNSNWGEESAPSSSS